MSNKLKALTDNKVKSQGIEVLITSLGVFFAFNG